MKVFTNEIYAHVKSKILSGEYAPGSRINLRTLGEIFNTSRLPIRDALNRLNGEGLVQQRTNGGYVVTPLTESDIRDTYELRGIIEGYLVGQAAQVFSPDQVALLEENVGEQEKRKQDIEEYSRLNSEFHEIFFRATGNAKFIAVLRQLRDYQARFDRINWYTNGAPFVNVTFRQHVEIVDAVRRKHSDLAERMLRLHMNTGVEFLIPALRNNGLLIG